MNALLNSVGSWSHHQAKGHSTTRRSFLKQAAAVAGSAIAMPTIIPSSALGA
ncbi:MAG: twin-arginine translocation signal domain-containing protein, partial [Verrucomicrobiales bacterium]|nr:twin-arginine translocation signal domain-containing protein [Verrucomicrobiales bacterium]